MVREFGTVVHVTIWNLSLPTDAHVFVAVENAVPVREGDAGSEPVLDGVCAIALADGVRDVVEIGVTVVADVALTDGTADELTAAVTVVDWVANDEELAVRERERVAVIVRAAEAVAVTVAERDADCDALLLPEGDIVPVGVHVLVCDADGDELTVAINDDDCVRDDDPARVCVRVPLWLDVCVVVLALLGEADPDAVFEVDAELDGEVEGDGVLDGVGV